MIYHSIQSKAYHERFHLKMISSSNFSSLKTQTNQFYQTTKKEKNDAQKNIYIYIFQCKRTLRIHSIKDKFDNAQGCLRL